MALMTWNSKYSVGVKTLDSQHTVLFGLLNDLHAAMLKGQAQSLTGPLLRKLLDYTNTHFSTEEKMLADAGYPGLADHKVKHRALIQKVEVTLNLHLMNFLRDWLTEHIQRTDREYSAWLHEHGAR